MLGGTLRHLRDNPTSKKRSGRASLESDTVVPNEEYSMAEFYNTYETF